MTGDPRDTRRELVALRDSLGLQLEALTTVRDYMRADLDESRRTWEAIAELRDELHALSNRVETLTRGLLDDGREHSRRAGLREVVEPLVVVSMEGDLPEVVGTYLRTAEDAVWYLSSVGVQTFAPADCVRIVRRDELDELRRQAARP